MSGTTLDERKARYAPQVEQRRHTMIERYGSPNVNPADHVKSAKMVLTDWFPDPDVPGVRMRILRGV